MTFAIYRQRMLAALTSVLLALIAGSCYTGPELPKRPEIVPPQPSGSLLNPQLRVAISPDFPPLAQKALLGAPVGLEVDFANQIGKELGKQIIFVEAPWPELINLLLANHADII